jgi:hypothetical protein
MVYARFGAGHTHVMKNWEPGGQPNPRREPNHRREPFPHTRDHLDPARWNIDLPRQRFKTRPRPDCYPRAPRQGPKLRCPHSGVPPTRASASPSSILTSPRDSRLETALTICIWPTICHGHNARSDKPQIRMYLVCELISIHARSSPTSPGRITSLYHE